MSNRVGGGNAAEPTDNEEDCLGCRLTSGIGLLFIGAYLFRESQRQTGMVSKITIASLSGVSVIIAMTRFLKIPVISKR